MTTTTTNLELLKINTSTDGNSTLNIDTHLHDNWDKIDAFAGDVDELISGGITNKQDKLSAPATKTGNYSILDLEWVLVNSTSNIISITLPSTGKVRISWTTGTNAVTIVGTVNGAANFIIPVLNASIDLESISAGQWRIV